MKAFWKHMKTFMLKRDSFFSVRNMFRDALLTSEEMW